MDKSISIGDNERDLIASKMAGIKKRYLISDKEDKLISNYAISSYKSLLECANAIKQDDPNKLNLY